MKVQPLVFRKSPPDNLGAGRLGLLILLGWLANLVGILGTAWAFMAKNRAVFYGFIALWVAGVILRYAASGLRRRRNRQSLDQDRQSGRGTRQPSPAAADPDAFASDQDVASPAPDQIPPPPPHPPSSSDHAP